MVQFTFSMATADTTGSNIPVDGNRGADAAPMVTRMHNAKGINKQIIQVHQVNSMLEGVWPGFGSVGRIPRPAGARSE